MQAYSPYEQLGGETGVRRLVDRFYDYMDELAEVQAVRAMHAKSLKASREKLFMFLSGWLGGPGLYEARYGHPRLRQRHLPFSIGVAERDQWLLCMSRALDEADVSTIVREHLMQQFRSVADHMRNKPEYDESGGKLPLFPG